MLSCRSFEATQFASDPTSFAHTMADAPEPVPRKGGRGHDEALVTVRQFRSRGFDEDTIRAHLFSLNFKKARVSQLLSQTRPASVKGDVKGEPVVKVEERGTQRKRKATTCAPASVIKVEGEASAMRQPATGGSSCTSGIGRTPRMRLVHLPLSRRQRRTMPSTARWRLS